MAAKFLIEGSNTIGMSQTKASRKYPTESLSSGPMNVTTFRLCERRAAMSLQKLLSGHLLPHTFHPPTKTPTVGLPVTQPGRACIRLLPSSTSALVRTNERRLSSGSRPRLRRNAGRTLYLFFSHGLGILTLNH